MSLTLEEQTRIENIEQALIKLKNRVDGAASRNMLERLLVLANKEVQELSTSISSLDTEVQRLITLAQKLQ